MGSPTRSKPMIKRSALDLFNLYDERWPDIGDRLFNAGRDARISQNAEERVYRLGKGYKLAGDRLIQNAFGHAADYEDLIYPIVFCYRHSIELGLKAIIEEHGSVAGVMLGKANHDLCNLWKLFLEIANELGHSSDADEVIAVGACIEELAAVDGGSTAFRYALTKRSDLVPLPSDGIDLKNLQAVMSGIRNFLECADQAFCCERDAISEALFYRALSPAAN
jgi:hypothetical protein